MGLWALQPLLGLPRSTFALPLSLATRVEPHGCADATVLCSDVDSFRVTLNGDVLDLELAHLEDHARLRDFSLDARYPCLAAPLGYQRA